MIINTPNHLTAAALRNLCINNQTAVGPWAGYYAEKALHEANTLVAVMSSLDRPYSTEVVHPSTGVIEKYAEPVVALPIARDDDTIMMYAATSREVFHFLGGGQNFLSALTTPEQLMEDAGEYAAKLFGSAAYYNCIATYGSNFSSDQLEKYIRSYGITPNPLVMPELRAMLTGVPSSQVIDMVNLSTSRALTPEEKTEDHQLAVFDSSAYYGGNAAYALALDTFESFWTVLAKFQPSFEWLKSVCAALFNAIKGTLDKIIQALGIRNIVTAFSFERDASNPNGLLDAPIFDHTFNIAELGKIYRRVNDMYSSGDRVDGLTFTNAVEFKVAKGSTIVEDENHGRNMITASFLRSASHDHFLNMFTLLSQRLYKAGYRDQESGHQRVVPCGNMVGVVTFWASENHESSLRIRITLYATSWKEQLYGLRPMEIVVDGDSELWNTASTNMDTTFTVRAIEAGQPMQWSRDSYIDLPDDPTPSDFWNAIRSIYSYANTSHGMMSSVLAAPGVTDPYFHATKFGLFKTSIINGMDDAYSAVSTGQTVDAETLVKVLETAWDNWSALINLPIEGVNVERDSAILAAYEVFAEIFGRLIISDPFFRYVYRHEDNGFNRAKVCSIKIYREIGPAGNRKFYTNMATGIHVNGVFDGETLDDILNFEISPVLSEVDLKGEYHVLTFQERYEKTRSTVIGVIAAVAALTASVAAAKILPRLSYYIARKRALAAQALEKFKQDPSPANWNELSLYNRKSALLGRFAYATGAKEKWDNRPTEILNLIR